MEKKALMVISFGSSVPEAVQALKNVEAYIHRSYPDRECYSSFTSSFIRKKLNKEGAGMRSPEELLQFLWEEGCKDVVMRPTHIIPGQEYDKMCELAAKWQDKFEHLELGRPLIYSNEDLLTVSKTVPDLYPLEEGEALLFMGHGTDHLSNFIYPALQTAWNLAGKNHVFMATLEGWPSLEDAMAQMKHAGYQKVYMAPFLLIAGAHVMRDMIGDGENSWLNILRENGYEVRYCEQGLSGFEEILELYCR